MNDSTNAAAATRACRALDYLHEFLASTAPSKPLAPAKLLEDLCRAFGVPGAGIAGPLGGTLQVQHRFPAGGPAQRFPWEDQPQLLTPLRGKLAAAVSCRGTGVSFLLAAMPGPEGNQRLIWLEGLEQQSWSSADESALVLAAQLLGPRLAEAPGNRFFLSLDEARLQQRLQDAGTISARIAHAFDNILTGILGFAELTLGQTPAASPNRQFLEEVVRAAQQGVQLTQQLHFFSRCAVPTVGPAVVAYATAEEEARLGNLLPPDVKFRVEVPADLPPVAIDAELLRQVLAHLLDNAREALAGPGSIVLTARRAELPAGADNDLLGQPVQGACVEIVVADSGPEIAPEVRRRLFQEPFFSTKPRHRGLGLAIVYRIVQAHRGCFRVASGPTATTVTLYLPLAVAAKT